MRDTSAEPPDTKGCVSNCRRCDEDGDCKECNYGYLLRDWKCFEQKKADCPMNCLECLAKSDKCTRCADDYLLLDGICEKMEDLETKNCGKYCKECLNDRECVTCERSYVGSKWAVL